MSETTTPAMAARCPCGECDTNDPSVTAHPQYSLSGWFLLAFGVTVVPKKIIFECKCGRKFAATTDPDQLRRHA